MDIERQREIPSLPQEIDSWPEPRPQRGPSGPAEIFKVFRKERPVLEIVQGTGFHGGPVSRRKTYQVTLWSWVASFIDALVLISVSCLFLLAFASFVRHADPGILHPPKKSLEKEFLVVFLMCSWIYMVTLRVLIGSSVGEWACDLRLGQPHERLKSFYPFRVAFRESLILATGLITLPLLSLLSGRDVAGRISGLKIFSLK